MGYHTSILAENRTIKFADQEVQKIWQEKTKYVEFDADVELIVENNHGKLLLLAVYEIYADRYCMYLEDMEIWASKFHLHFHYTKEYKELSPCPAGAICSTCQSEIQEMYDEHPCLGHFCQCNRCYTD